MEEENATWAALKHFAKSEQQIIWIKRELLAVPPGPDLDPFTWLLWRSKVAEGVSEAEAWAWVEYTNNKRIAEQSVDIYAQDQGGFKQEADVNMGMAGYVKAEEGVKLERNHDGYETHMKAQPVAAYYTGAGPSMKTEVKEEVMPQVPVADEGHQRYVQMNDILPLPSDAVPYDDMEVDETIESFDASGSGASSSGSDDDNAPIIRRTSKDASGQKPTPPPLNRPNVIPFATGKHLPQPNGTQLLDPALRSISPRPPNTGSPSTHAAASSSTATPRQPSKSRSPPKSATALPVVPNGVGSPAPPVALPTTMTDIRTLIAPARLRKDTETPRSLWKLLRKRIDEGEPKFSPTPAELREIMVAIRTHAPYSYKKEMADIKDYVDQINRYLKAMAKDPVKWEVAIQPTIILLSETIMTMKMLTDSKIGRTVKVVAEKADEKGLKTAPQIKAAFLRYMDHCENTILKQKRPASPTPVAEPKKRKIDAVVEAGPSKRPAPANGKKPTPIATTAAPRTANATAGPSRTTTGPAEAKPKPTSAPPSATAAEAKKPKILPGFKKRDPSDSTSTPATVPSPTTAAPPPAEMSMLEKAKALMAKNQMAAGRSIAQINATPVEPPTVGRKTKLNKKGQTVRFVDAVLPAKPLVQWKHLDYTYQDYGWGDDEAHLSSHQMDVDEGQAMRKDAALTEEDDAEDAPKELIEWYQPELYIDAPLPPPTPEAVAQEARERGLLAAPGGSAPDESAVKIASSAPGMIYPLHENVVAPDQPNHLNIASTVASLLSSLGNLPAVSLPGGVQPLGHLGNHHSHSAHNFYSQAPPSYPGQQQHPHQQSSEYSGHAQYNNGYTAPGSAYPGQQGWQPGPPSGQGGYAQQGDGHASGGWGGPHAQAWNGGGDGDRPSAGGPSRRSGGGGGGSGGGADTGRGGGSAGRGRGGRRGKGQRPCTFFAKGFCAKEENCEFRH